MRKSFFALFAAAALAACDDSASVDLGLDAQASVSFAAQGQSGLFSNRAPNDPFSISGHTIAVSRVELRASEIEFEGDNDLKMELKGGTTVVAVPMNGSLVTPITANVAAGSYHEFEMEVQTVRIVGTYDGAPFDVTVKVDDEIELDLFPPLQVEAGSTANVTVALSVVSWFRNSDGSAIDPRGALATFQSRLASNIKASFEAFEDDDRDGED